LEIAQRWFELHRVEAGITRLIEPHVHPFLRCNLWHVRGRDQDLLIDTGIGIAPVRPALADLLDRPLAAVATHVHYDHVGGLHEFAERVMHALEAGRMADYREFATLATDAFPAHWLALAPEPGFERWLIDAVPDSGFDPLAWRVRAASITRIVEEGDVLDLGNRRFEVLHLPGHSPGSIGLYERATGILFSGDAIYDGVLLDDLPDSDREAYVRTMHRLRELPVTVVHGGHEASFGRARLQRLIDDYLAAR
jgi:glyoxylase-like metal-dependent hydrolase (beta-lactamase superfamily II)